MRGGVPVSPSVDVPMPQARILYGQKDISSDISPYLISVSYTDRLSGESDELELRLEDTDGRWRGDWYPGKGDALTVSIGYAGQELVSCGSFEIDEIELSFPPDEVSIRALATGIKLWDLKVGVIDGRAKARAMKRPRWPAWCVWSAEGWG